MEHEQVQIGASDDHALQGDKRHPIAGNIGVLLVDLRITLVELSAFIDDEDQSRSSERFLLASGKKTLRVRLYEHLKY